MDQVPARAADLVIDPQSTVNGSADLAGPHGDADHDPSRSSRCRGTTRVAVTSVAIEGTVEFTATHRAAMKALLEIFLAGGLRCDAATDQAVVGQAEAILRQGQADGKFRDFDPRGMGAAVQRAAGGLPFLLEATPDLDCGAFARELVTLFDLGTRASTSGTQAYTS